MIQTRELYTSANGDRWLVAHDPGTEHVFVRHEANPASGGHTTEFGIAEFLARNAGGPEHEALMRLIGELRPAGG